MISIFHNNRFQSFITQRRAVGLRIRKVLHDVSHKISDISVHSLKHGASATQDMKHTWMCKTCTVELVTMRVNLFITSAKLHKPCFVNKLL